MTLHNALVNMRRRLPTIREALAITCLALGSSEPRAAQAGDMAISAGWIVVSPRSTSGPFRTTQINDASASIDQPGTGASIGSAQTLDVTASFAAGSRTWLQVVLGWPVRQDLSGTGSLAPFGAIGEGKAFSPALLLKQEFGGTSGFRPFVSFGFAYTTYRDLRITNDSFRLATYGPVASTNVSASSSFSPVLSAGIDADIGPRWYINSSLSYNPHGTAVTVQASGTPIGSVTNKLDLELRAVSASIGIGYRF